MSTLLATGQPAAIRLQAVLSGLESFQLTPLPAFCAVHVNFYLSKQLRHLSGTDTYRYTRMHAS